MSIEMRAFGAAAFAGLFVVGGTLCFAKLMTPPTSAESLPAESQPALNAEVIQGGAYYQKSCARCHASDGFGKGDAPSLHEEDMTDSEIVDEIKYGENRMPAFGKQYTDDQIQTVTRYVRSLN